MHLVIIGYGYSSEAIARELRPTLASLHVTARSPEKVARLRAEGLDASVFDGTSIPAALAEALARANAILISAPPSEAGDPLLNAPGFAGPEHGAQKWTPVLPNAMRQNKELEPGFAPMNTQRSLAMEALSRIVYLSTVGVYGDHGGAWVTETTEPRPGSQRSRQRVAAEAAWQAFAGARGLDLTIFRLSGIYGPGRSAIDGLRNGTARRIIKPGQVFNRIHVADISGAVGRALTQEKPPGIYNLTDDEPCPPQDVVVRAARLLGLAPPPEIPFDEAELSPMGRSFYGENKRVSNARIKAILGYSFRCPTYREGLAACL